MMLKKGFVLRQIADMWVVLPVGAQTVNFTAMLNLNDAGALLWKALEAGADRDGLVAALTAEYEVDDARAAADVDAFLAKLAQAGCLC